MSRVAGHLRSHRWLAVACLVVVVAQAIALATLTQRSDAGEPHAVPIVIAAPAVVAAALADEAAAMPGEPFDPTWTDDASAARAAVVDGDAVAAVLVDLRGTHDVVLVNGHNDAELNDAVVQEIRTIERTRDRTFDVESVGATASDAADRLRLYVLLCGGLGFGSVLVLSLVRGPIARSATLGVVRVLLLAAMSVVGAAVLQLLPTTSLPGSAPAAIGIGALYAFTLGVAALAVEALAGLVGLAAVAGSYLVLATPYLSGTDDRLLPEPWPTIASWMPLGAAQRSLASVAYFDPHDAIRPTLLVAGVATVSVIALVLARWGRDEELADQTHMTNRHWRLWVIGSTVPLAGLVAVAITLVPAEADGPRPLPSVASETSCVADARAPRSVADLNRQISTMQGDPAFLGADVGADVRLQDGRYLLVFGDTLRGADFDGPQFARNSMMLWGDECVSVVLPPSHGALIPDRSDGVGYWPMSAGVAHRPGYDLVLVSTQRVDATGAGSFDFANLGPALAVFLVADGETPQLIATQDVGPDSSDLSRPAWGAAMAVDGDWLYLYGTAHPDDDSVYGFSLQVARVHPDDVLERSRWRYWDGGSWQRHPGDAAELVPAAGGVSQTLSVFHEDGTWYALSKRDGDLGDQLVIWTAPGPTGPFTPGDPVATIASDPDTGEVTYMPLAHPDILPARGTVVASYSRNNTDVDKIRADPTLYRPTFLRVPLP
jgi:hypothetical protein